VLLAVSHVHLLGSGLLRHCDTAAAAREGESGGSRQPSRERSPRRRTSAGWLLPW
jgi:hypothetical protein